MISQKCNFVKFFCGMSFVMMGWIVLELAMQIEKRGLGNSSDPGPRAFPILIAFMLIGGGIYELIPRKTKCENADSNDSNHSNLSNHSADFNFTKLGLRRAGIVFVGLVLYVASMDYLGFATSTLIFSAIMMIYLGIGYPLSIGAASGIVLIIHLLFVRLFKISLPTGVIGLPF